MITNTEGDLENKNPPESCRTFSNLILRSNNSEKQQGTYLGNFVWTLFEDVYLSRLQLQIYKFGMRM